MDPIRTARPGTASQIFRTHSLNLLTFIFFQQLSFVLLIKLTGPKSTELEVAPCSFQIILNTDFVVAA